jgi:hypothetical protein
VNAIVRVEAAIDMIKGKTLLYRFGKYGQHFVLGFLTYTVVRRHFETNSRGSMDII